MKGNDTNIMMSFKKLLNWKYEDGYRYVAVNEYTGSVEFIRAGELNSWFAKRYLQYMMEEKDPQIQSISEYRTLNMPDRIQDMTASCSA